MTAAIASSIWTAYEKYGSMAFNEDRLKALTVECEDGHLIIQQVASVLLCMHANKDVQLGCLKAKVTTLVDYLDGPLNQVSNIWFRLLIGLLFDNYVAINWNTVLQIFEVAFHCKDIREAVLSEILLAFVLKTLVSFRVYI